MGLSVRLERLHVKYLSAQQFPINSEQRCWSKMWSVCSCICLKTCFAILTISPVCHMPRLLYAGNVFIVFSKALHASYTNHFRRNVTCEQKFSTVLKLFLKHWSLNNERTCLLFICESQPLRRCNTLFWGLPSLLFVTCRSMRSISYPNHNL